MAKVVVILLFMTLFVQQIAGQTNQSDYSVFINYASDPGLLGFNGRMFKFRGDTLLMMDRNGQKQVDDSTFVDQYDTTCYRITNAERRRIITNIKSVDSLQSIFNFCMIDGLRFYFSCSIDTVEHTAWVSNVYDPRIFLFVDIINAHVPKDFQIRYDKKQLIRERKECLKRRFGAKK